MLSGLGNQLQLVCAICFLIPFMVNIIRHMDRHPSRRYGLKRNQFWNSSEHCKDQQIGCPPEAEAGAGSWKASRRGIVPRASVPSADNLPQSAFYPSALAPGKSAPVCPQGFPPFRNYFGRNGPYGLFVTRAMPSAYPRRRCTASC